MDWMGGLPLGEAGSAHRHSSSSPRPSPVGGAPNCAIGLNPRRGRGEAGGGKRGGDVRLDGANQTLVWGGSVKG